MHTSHVYLLETTVITCLMTFVQYGGIAAAAHRLNEPCVFARSLMQWSLNSVMIFTTIIDSLRRWHWLSGLMGPSFAVWLPHTSTFVL